jgi:predicted kinase
MKKDNRQRLFEVMERINPDFQQKKPRLLLPVGISGSGKSTWIKSNTDPNTVVVSFDDIRREISKNVSDQSKHFDVINLGLKKVADSLNAGKNVILDATNVKSKDRKSLMDYLKVHVDKPFDAFAKIFDVDPEVAKQRVRKDITGGIDRSDVPDWAIDRHYQNFINDMNSIETDGFKIID